MDINTVTEAFIAPLRTAFWDSFFHIVAIITKEQIFFSFIILIALWTLFNPIVREKIEFELLTIVGASGSALLLKYITNVHRPFPIPVAMGSEHTPSFPSLHATVIVALIGSLFVTVYPRITSKFKRILFTALSFFVIVVVLASRLYLRVHYMTDIIGGCIIGILWIVIALCMMRR